MKLFNKKVANRTVNINGTNVKFTNCVAEVEDSFGKEALLLGIPDLYEYGKQPLFETPKEIQMKSEFNDKEEWYKSELVRLTNMKDSYKKKIDELEVEIKNWKAEYEKEHQKRLALVEASKYEKPEEVHENISEEMAEENATEIITDDEEMRKEMADMKKDELIQLGIQTGLDMDGVKSKTKAEIIEFLISHTQE